MSEGAYDLDLEEATELLKSYSRTIISRDILIQELREQLAYAYLRLEEKK
jgi:hypothetical protein